MVIYWWLSGRQTKLDFQKLTKIMMGRWITRKKIGEQKVWCKKRRVTISVTRCVQTCENPVIFASTIICSILLKKNQIKIKNVKKTGQNALRFIFNLVLAESKAWIVEINLKMQNFKKIVSQSKHLKEYNWLHTSNYVFG